MERTNNMEKSFSFSRNQWIAIVVFVLVFVGALMLRFFGLLETWQQFSIVLLSASATYLVVSITLSYQNEQQQELQQKLLEKQSELQQELMERQSKKEDDAKRDLELYNAKLGVYSNFVSKMYDILSDNKVEEDEILDLRTHIFGKISFYANGDIVEKINERLATVKNYTDVKPMQKVFADIASILQKDLRADWPVNVKSAYSLWDTFDNLLEEADKEEQLLKNEIDATVDIPEKESTTEMVPSYINNNFWHFTMWGSEEQIRALRDGVYELNLVEYNEEWRTNQLKRVKKDDLVFLFRSGGWGYMGVFRVKGWRIFEFGNGNILKETVNIFGEKQVDIEDAVQREKDRQRSDIYNSIQNGATLCSSIIVEPLAFSRKGIGNPGGVYRRTISSYDREYGMKQLARFMAIIDDPNLYNVHYDGETTVKMGCNRELFEQILASGNIQPAQRDEKGAWL